MHDYFHLKPSVRRRYTSSKWRKYVRRRTRETMRLGKKSAALWRMGLRYREIGIRLRISTQRAQQTAHYYLKNTGPK